MSPHAKKTIIKRESDKVPWLQKISLGSYGSWKTWKVMEFYNFIFQA